MYKNVAMLVASMMASVALADAVRVDGAWARATAPGAPTGAVFMNLTADADMKLVAAESPAAKVVELHTMKVDNGVMIMRPVAEIVLPKGKTVALKPGGLHVMLIGLKAPLKGGEKTALTLKMRDSKGTEHNVVVHAEIKAMEDTSVEHAHHHH